MSRRGFTLIEMLSVFAIMALLAALALPKLSTVQTKAEATSVIADYGVIRHAALDVLETTGSWPVTGADGEVPAGMATSLPGGFQFTHGATTYRWRTWALPDGLPGNPSDTVVVGVEVSSDNAELMASLRQLYRGPLAFGTNTRMTLVIE